MARAHARHAGLCEDQWGLSDLSTEDLDGHIEGSVTGLWGWLPVNIESLSAPSL